MTDHNWTDEYKVKVRAFMETHGKPVEVQPKRYGWEEDDEVSPYGWTDYDALYHCKPKDKWGEDAGDCTWVVPEGARLYERTYSQFVHTDTGNDDQVGINVTGCRCACGKYTDIILRYSGGLAEITREITGVPKRAEIEL